MVALLRSFRAVQAVARPALALPKVQVARAFSASALRRGGGGPPQLLGDGVKPGEVPTDRQQATGIERFELIGKAEGVDVFDLTPLEADRLGTLDNPIEVFSYYPERHVGCTGFPADSHDTIWLHVTKELKNHRCPECGSVYTLKFEPNADYEAHAHH
ncbi:cytochrome c oxidase polypeptide IV [Cutaneotrichosporon oleaginosum]|uniref:Cytochrome c oxidase subunit 4, mitochondrial n=1 Tax=Cutaneotrichosporon oleaginosum TaxID=879819 RepID=A0A0J0XSG5_9TREE|nr:cytochrome c oxidase polypeptide IV [Cutaneotrichosporon oleaginosum]KLT44012.1 cytochrome c oxidase polypeptide IV [Cutaneotrichosporon oleaginosum]TXT04041.1 hypothetical protein COLE_07738 [Cutaneotrichosporon oleaginosum]